MAGDGVKKEIGILWVTIAIIAGFVGASDVAIMGALICSSVWGAAA